MRGWVGRNQQWAQSRCRTPTSVTRCRHDTSAAPTAGYCLHKRLVNLCWQHAYWLCALWQRAAVGKGAPLCAFAVYSKACVRSLCTQTLSAYPVHTREADTHLDNRSFINKSVIFWE